MHLVNNKTKFVSLLILPFLLSGCARTFLDPEIKAFVENFSYAKAREQVKKGKFVSSMSGVDVDLMKVEETETIEFSISEQNEINFTYESHALKGTEEKDIKYQVLFENGKHYYVKDDTKNEITLDAANGYVDRFFYAQLYQSTNYHYGASYYGDIIVESVVKQQKFVQIEDEKSIYHYCVEGFKESDFIMKIDYKVNKLGMLISLKDEGSYAKDPTIKFVQEITVTY